MGRLILAGIVAGVALFVWGAVEHMMTPIGEMGIAGHPHEAMLLPAIQQTTPKPGLYMFPWLDMSKKPTKEQEQAYIEKYKTGPHGMLVLGPNGEDPMPPSRLAKELFANILTAIVAAFLLAKFATGLGGFVSGGIITFLIGWMSISVPHWNWYSFPAPFVLAELIDQLIGGAIVGLVVGLVMARRRA
ncbi:MAG TPA: hypothetical protein VI198_02500 [Candidatus Eisenbacteria bacterium]